MIKDEITEAKALYNCYGEEMFNNHDIRKLVEDYRKAIVKSHELMKELSIIKTCAACAHNLNAGSCCFKGVEEWYDHILLFMNFMLGVEITTNANILDGCLFVGKKGCSLLARHAFCINYLCPSLNNFLTSSQKESLRSVSGDELYRGWELERSVRHWIRFNSIQDHP